MDYELATLFPQTVMRTSLGRDLSPAEMQRIVHHAETMAHNEFNSTSRERYVLDEAPFSDLRQQLLHAVEVYAFQVLKYQPTFALRITQSWLNFAEKGQFHHGHTHQNSFLSGVLYIQTGNENESSEITFGAGVYRAIKPMVSEWNAYNSEEWHLSVAQGDIVVFPSSLSHHTKQHQSSKTRISLAFNTFFTGVMGDYLQSAELRI